jgi:hypothetical protein
MYTMTITAGCLDQHHISYSLCSPYIFNNFPFNKLVRNLVRTKRVDWVVRWWLQHGPRMRYRVRQWGLNLELDYDLQQTPTVHTLGWGCSWEPMMCFFVSLRPRSCFSLRQMAAFLIPWWSRAAEFAILRCRVDKSASKNGEMETCYAWWLNFHEGLREGRLIFRSYFRL